MATTKERYKKLSGILECLCVDLSSETEKLPQADLLIANLLIEYIGYECFQKAVKIVNPKYVSCIIQINTDESFVSDSPYLHAFDGLECVHQQMEEKELKKKECMYCQRTLPWNYPYKICQKCYGRRYRYSYY